MGGRKSFDVEYFRPLRTGDVIRVRIDVERGRVTAFTMQLECYVDEEWRPVVRYDSAHGQPHRDVLDWDGRVIEKDWLSPAMAQQEVIRFAERDLSDNALHYRAAFEERKP